jgi:hypothetical protein
MMENNDKTETYTDHLKAIDNALLDLYEKRKEYKQLLAELEYCCE